MADARPLSSLAETLVVPVPALCVVWGNPSFLYAILSHDWFKTSLSH